MSIYTYNSAKLFCEILDIEFRENPIISDQLIDEGHSSNQHWGFVEGHTINNGRKRPQSEEEIANRSARMLGNKLGVGGPGSRGKKWNLSEESKNRQRLAKLGTKQKQVQCPHCKKSGGVSNMVRYHFDECKYIINERKSKVI